MNTKGLYLKYAQIIKMCEGSKVDPWECVHIKKYPENSEYIKLENHPDFRILGRLYVFAVGIVEQKPVFVGDSLYFPNGAFCTICEDELPQTISVLSWQPPKAQLPPPQKDWSPFNLDLNTWRPDGRLSGMRYYFKSEADVIKATEMIRNMLQDAMK